MYVRTEGPTSVLASDNSAPAFFAVSLALPFICIYTIDIHAYIGAANYSTTIHMYT